MFATGKAAILLFLAIALLAHAEDAPVTLLGREHFYNAVGASVKVAWSANPTELSADAEIMLTMKITGTTNPDRVRRPDLASMPAFKAQFSSILKGNDAPAAPDAKVVTFTFRLRPRDANVQNIPDLPFAYYVPGDADLRTTYFDEIPLKVRPATPVALPALPMIERERFFAIPSEEALRRGYTPPPDGRHWSILFAFLGLATLTAAFTWRRRNPDGARLARLRQNRAVRTALDALDGAASSRDALATAARAFQTYLAQRFGLFTPATAPGEIEAALRGSNLSDDKVMAAVELYRNFDASRFGGQTAAVQPLIEQTRELILRWEGAK